MIREAKLMDQNHRESLGPICCCEMATRRAGSQAKTQKRRITKEREEFVITGHTWLNELLPTFD